MLRNETYPGVKYFNTTRTIREYANPIYDIKHSTKKNIKRSREDWIGVEVPAIISRELFDRVQARRAVNRKRYRNPKQTQLLSTLVRCGGCGGSVYAYRRWERSKRKGPPLSRNTARGRGCGLISAPQTPQVCDNSCCTTSKK
jgi:site-specific DNA recombinase